MSLIDDVLNGGIDRNLDGDIDKRDRDVMFAEKAIAKEKERRETMYEDYYDDEDDEFDDETDEFDDEDDDVDESYSSYRHSATVSASEKKKATLFATPIYNGQKLAKDDKVIIEWENMPAEIAKKAKKAYSVYLLCLTLFLLGIVIALMLPAVFYDYIDDLSSFFGCGLIVGFVGFILTCRSSRKSFERTKYYTRIEDKNGRKKYRSGYEVDNERNKQRSVK